MHEFILVDTTCHVCRQALVQLFGVVASIKAVAHKRDKFVLWLAKTWVELFFFANRGACTSIVVMPSSLSLSFFVLYFSLCSIII